MADALKKRHKKAYTRYSCQGSAKQIMKNHAKCVKCASCF